MKNFIITLILSIFISISSARNADFVLHTKNPQSLSNALINISQKHWNSKSQDLKLILLLTTFGYPFFNGVSHSENMILCGFEDVDDYYLVAMVKASEKSNLSVLTKKMNSKRIDDWLMVEVYKTSNSKMNLDACLEAFNVESKINHNQLANLKINSSALKNLKNIYPQLDILEALIKQVDYINIKLEADAQDIALQTDIYAKHSSDLEHIFKNSSMLNAQIQERQFIDEDSFFVAKGAINIEKVSPYLSKIKADMLKKASGKSDEANLNRIDTYLKNSYGTFAMHADKFWNYLFVSKTKLSFDEVYQTNAILLNQLNITQTQSRLLDSKCGKIYATYKPICYTLKNENLAISQNLDKLATFLEQKPQNNLKEERRYCDITVKMKLIDNETSTMDIYFKRNSLKQRLSMKTRSFVKILKALNVGE